MKYKILFIISFLIFAGAGCQTQRPPSVADLAANPKLAEPKEEVPLTEEPKTLELNIKAPTTMNEQQIENKVIRIKTQYGDIVFELFPTEAPLAAGNFVSLTGKGFYNGLTFHRVEPDFVIQGGDPKGDGTGGPGYMFKDETVTRDYLEGTVAMANSGPDTNGSQFFIMLKDTPQLPKKYTIFGKVISGMDVVKSIQPGDKMLSVTVEDRGGAGAEEQGNYGMVGQ